MTACWSLLLIVTLMTSGRLLLVRTSPFHEQVVQYERDQKLVDLFYDHLMRDGLFSAPIIDSIVHQVTIQGFSDGKLDWLMRYITMVLILPGHQLKKVYFPIFLIINQLLWS
jgi:hypothetical protein